MSVKSPMEPQLAANRSVYLVLLSGWLTNKVMILHSSSSKIDGFREVSEWSETHFFFKEGSGRMISFELYGGLKLPKIGPDDLFCNIRPLQGQ